MYIKFSFFLFWITFKINILKSKAYATLGIGVFNCQYFAHIYG
jgi:hypothetical protein